MGADKLIFSDCGLCMMGEERAEADVLIRIAPVVIQVEVDRTVIGAISTIATDYDLGTPEQDRTPAHTHASLLNFR